jgi:type IV pilus assembly protein PilY1
VSRIRNSLFVKECIDMMDEEKKTAQLASLKKVRLCLILFVFLSVLIWIPRGVLADDTEIYALQELPPNVLIVLDHSGSMLNEDAGGVYDDTRTYVPWVGMPDLGNYDNWYNYNRTRWQIAKNVITHLLDETEGVRFGLIRMDGSSKNTGTGDDSGILLDRMDPPRGITYTPGDPSGRVLRQGGKILCPVGMDKNLIIDVVNQMPNNDPQTWTVLAETLYTAGQYFAGGNDSLGMGAYKVATDYTYRICTDSDGDCYDGDEEWSSYQARTTDDEGNPIDTSSPIEYWCQPSFVILMTDGQSNYDDDWSLMTSVVGDYDGDGDEAINANRYLDDVAKFLYDNDLRADMEETQNIVTYTIAFSMTDGPAKDLVESAAQKGGGQYYTADNFDQLRWAFQNILGEILEISTSYTAPVVPISQMEKTTSGSNIYLALFKPTRNAFWKGNIKKFGLASSDDPANGIEQGDVLDRYGSRATDDNGYIYDTAVSYWGTDPDGGDTELGGVGGALVGRTLAREIYTWTKIDKPLKQPNNAFTKDNSKLTYDMFGVADDAEKNKVIDFIYGLDAYDEDGDLDTTEKRKWILGSFIHSRPEFIHYSSTTTVIYAGANDGLFHAFDDATGEELWAFVRPDLLDKLKTLNGNSMQYFYDAPPRAIVIDNDHDGNIEINPDGDMVFLVFGERRGGNHTYALDVSDPYDPILHWDIDFNLADFSEMGQSWCTPAFGRIAYDNRLVVFLSGGYDPNQDADPVINPDTMGRGIYVVDLIDGSLVWKYTHAEDANMVYSIPSDIAAIDTTDNGLVDRLYVGDMGGQLWRFDIGSTNPTNWTGEILFNANSSVSPGDPLKKIFYPPDVTQEEGYEMVFFGTGNRAHPNEETVIDRIYAVKDRDTGVTLDENSLENVTDDLLQDSSYAGDKDALRTQILNGNGWYIRLVDNLGEKVLSPPIVFDRTAYFTTFTPTLSGGGDPCVLEEGTARLYALGYRTGEAVLNFDTSSQAVGRSDRSLVIGSSIPSGLVIAILHGKPVAYIGVRGGIFKPDVANPCAISRIYWRQIF